MKTPVKIRFLVLISLTLLFSSCEKEKNTPIVNLGDYSVFAWNDLGMHCLNPTYDKFVVLPPYNNVMAQVVRRGPVPQIVTAGITVSYKLIDNTTSSNKGSFGGFWQFANKLFGVTPANDIGLTGNGLSGNMKAADDHFVADGIPVVPIKDNGTWDPYQVAEITVKDGSGNILAQTRATVPTSDEMNCAKCHEGNAFNDILMHHDQEFGTNFSAVANQPVLCASCHPDPALGITSGSQVYLSLALHRSHAGRTGITCYDCHPGNVTKCARSLKHTAADGNCIECHGTMAQVASSIEAGRTPWAEEPSCAECHGSVTGVATGAALYRNSLGHGGMYCSSCHGSPHAMYPTNQVADSYQSIQYQGSSTRIKSIGSCGVCHDSSRGEEISEFGEEHGGSNPEKRIGCHACHTSIPTDTAKWPHAFTWKNSN